MPSLASLELLILVANGRWNYFEGCTRSRNWLFYDFSILLGKCFLLDMLRKGLFSGRSSFKLWVALIKAS